MNKPTHTTLKKFTDRLADSLFAFPRAMIDVLEDLDAPIISREGHEVLADPEKMKKVKEAMKKHEEEGNDGPIIVQF